jgi:hypothetical protein
MMTRVNRMIPAIRPDFCALFNPDEDFAIVVATVIDVAVAVTVGVVVGLEPTGR